MTDLHLDRASTEILKEFFERIRVETCDSFLITGDISVASLLPDHLLAIARAASPRNVYFVAGNHDFFGSNFADVDDAILRACRVSPNLHHLGGGEIISLSATTALTGHRGWADARAGQRAFQKAPQGGTNSIEDFQGCEGQELFARMEALGRKSAEYFRQVLPRALSRFPHVIIATHFPPFVQAARFNNQPCGAAFQPHYVNISAGGAIAGIARAYPGRRITVLSGHTHSGCTLNITRNVRVCVGTAVLGKPTIQGVMPIGCLDTLAENAHWMLN